MALFGYFASLLIGVSLGLIGGGGSILTVPVLVYLFGLNPLLATSYSLFVVGSTSFVGALNNFRKRLVHLKAVVLFGSSSLVTVFATRRFLVPAIPQNLAQVGSFTLTSSLLTMVLFAVLMLLASVSMIRGRKEEAHASECAEYFTVKKLLDYGIGIGLITGLLGAGGGFLLIPALVLLLRLPMKMAVGTSLLIIALNSLIGFAGDLGHVAIRWGFLLRITAIAVAGIFLGGAIGKKIAGERLKKGFGWFVLLMGTYILVRETLLK
ncbi:sulfite exporter TauE/SafE family protein [Flaviaesturariibacter flavus]|uniref:Probable membrane transporter protein n=1 Tax=Flaviaesturariibacter flavus TaxID=2502780 RepID=A0A4R1B2T2_9BACT|nr:sulfite exporter TauE/SafE family protein [Flaviaesturariibacter flavus]TCJ12141.1 sulfite exporter TauE/SafE family protein [Flaviaesturariibacter flavus]